MSKTDGLSKSERCVVEALAAGDLSVTQICVMVKSRGVSEEDAHDAISRVMSRGLAHLTTRLRVQLSDTRRASVSPSPPTPRETIVRGSTVLAIYADGIAVTKRGKYIGGVQWEQGQEHEMRRALRGWVR